jgi:multidrug resistance efflux pump
MVARRNAISGARQRREQAQKRLAQADEDMKAAVKTLEISRDVATQNAKERLEQAQQRVDQAEQRVSFAKVDYETARLNRDRVLELEKEGARSKRDAELAIQTFTKATTDLEVAKKQLEIAKRDVNLGGLDQKRINLEVERENTRVARAREAVKIAQDDIYNATYDLNRLMADTAATLNSVGGSIQSARETVAKNNSDIVKIDIDRRNLVQRVSQQDIRAPRSGRVVRLNKVGAGEIVKVGDELAYIAPDTTDQHVELYVSDNDLPLISVGRHVRLQFAGWPAVQVGGFPSVQFGTFGGKIKAIDAVDDGTRKFRIIVAPEQQRLVGNKLDPKWPEPSLLRPGAAVEGWIMLDTVPLGFELWRQFNALPPRLQKAPPRFGKDGKGKEGESDKPDKAKDKGANTIKVKAAK